MLPTERKQQILQVLKDRQEASVQGLAELLKANPASIRRDLRDLEEAHRIERRHGKAVYRPALPLQLVDRETPLSEAHFDDLVQQTVAVLDEVRNIFLSGGPVLVRAAAELHEKTIVTHDLKVALAAATAGDNDVSLLGTDIDSQTLTVKPRDLEAKLADFWFDVAVVEAEGLDQRSVFVSRTNHAIVASLRKRSSSLVVVGKSVLFDKRADRVMASFRDVDVLLIDRGINAQSQRDIEEAGVEVRTAGDDPASAFNVFDRGNVVVFQRLEGNPFARGKPARPHLDEDEG